MDLDVLANEFLDDDISTVQIQTVGRDKENRVILTTIVIDYFDGDYQYNVTSKPLQVD